VDPVLEAALNKIELTLLNVIYSFLQEPLLAGFKGHEVFPLFKTSALIDVVEAGESICKDPLSLG
jgi:hypothetical protein